ncbi:MAG: 50S ribosomal protein L4 [Rickettsiales bacterium]|nr:50S ribosomal protein L4 [Rickettsiales bacterium]
MKLDVINFENKKTGEVELNQDIFAQPIRKDILHQIVNWQLAKRRSGTQSTLTRSEVHGTTKKPFKQKGTGHARQGSLKGPHQRHGGVSHAPKPRSYEFKLNKKFVAKGLKVALSLKASEGSLKILESAVIENCKTKDAIAKIKNINAKNALFVRGSADKDNFYKSVQAINNVDVIPQTGLNVYDILNHKNLVITKHALEDLQKRLGGENGK